MNLAPYLDRLGLAPPLPATLETLRRVHVAHLGAFPFHNLTIQRGGAVTVDVDSILARFLTAGGGGYCFEQNTLLGAALRELGFEVTTFLARVGPPEKRALNHMLLRVDVAGEPWLADVGFGGEGPLHPLPLKEGRVAQDGIGFALRRDAHHWTLSMHCGGVDEDHYEFTGTPHTAGDVVMANWYTSTHPESIFRRTMTIQRITPEERIILRPSIVTRYRNGVRTDTPTQPAQIRTFAKELFGIEVGDAPLLFEKGESTEPLIDHIQITVQDMSVATAFYDKLLPLLGFEPQSRGSAVIEEHELEVVEYTHPRLSFAISSPRRAFAHDAIHRRKPGALHHLAFRAPSRADVDRLHRELQDIGATIVGAPREYPEYKPAPYYAVFFKDPEGIKYEVVCAGRDGTA